MAETFIHPQSEKEIFGEQLVPGDVLREGDVYPSTTGEWQDCPAGLPGQKLGPKCVGFWVRPEQFEHLMCIDGVTECHESIKRMMCIDKVHGCIRISTGGKECQCCGG